MAADFDKPTVSNTHVNIWPQVRDNESALARMFSDGGEANIPLRAVRFLNNTMYLWNGSIWEVAPVAIGGGGTGAETAASARANLGTDVATNVTSGVFNADRIPTLSITDKTSGTLGGTRVDQSTTGARGTVQLNNTLTSTSTTQALTAAQGKALADAPRVTSSGSNANGYYRVWSDGYKEQWSLRSIAANSFTDWTFPIPFTSTNGLSLQGSATSSITGAGRGNCLIEQGATTTSAGFSVEVIARQCYLQAKGY